MTKKSVESCRRSTKTSKKIQFRDDYKKVFGKYVAGAFVATVLMGNTFNASANVEGIEKVQEFNEYDEQLAVAVDKKTKIEKMVQEKIREIENLYKGKHSFEFGDQVSYISEVVFNAKDDNAQALEEFRDSFELMVKAAPLMINGRFFGYVESEFDAKEVVRQLQLKFIAEEDLAVVQANGSLDESVVLKAGESKVIDIHIEEGASYSPEESLPEDVMTVNEAVEFLQRGSLQEKKHSVTDGEVLGSIATKYNLSLERILKLNPGLTETSVLQIGDVLNVEVYKPLLNVVVKSVSLENMETPFETEVIESGDLLKGETKIKREGKKGSKSVRFAEKSVNGIKVEKNILEEKVVSEPVDKIVLRGTKIMPSRGTGKLAWPTVGGYISSKMGYRWGRMHKGIDIARPSNRSILATDNGTVEFAGWDGGYGNKIVINHKNGMKTLYAHLSNINVRVGQTVEKGGKIGVMGTTGNSTGIHLHLEVLQNGRNVNPLKFY